MTIVGAKQPQADNTVHFPDHSHNPSPMATLPMSAIEAALACRRSLAMAFNRLQGASMKLILYIVIAGFGCVCLPSYSAAPPVNDCKQAFENHIKEQSEGRIRLLTFKKLEGTQGEVAEVEVYALEYEAEVEFTENCKWLNGEGGYTPSLLTVKPVSKSKDSSLRYVTRLDNAQRGLIVQAGQRLILAGVINFIKKDGAWILKNTKIRTYQ